MGVGDSFVSWFNEFARFLTVLRWFFIEFFRPFWLFFPWSTPFLWNEIQDDITSRIDPQKSETSKRTNKSSNLIFPSHFSVVNPHWNENQTNNLNNKNQNSPIRLWESTKKTFDTLRNSINTIISLRLLRFLLNLNSCAEGVALTWNCEKIKLFDLLDWIFVLLIRKQKRRFLFTLERLRDVYLSSDFSFFISFLF